MSEKTASRPEASTNERDRAPNVERDTLPAIDQLLLRDQLEALLSSSALGPAPRTAAAELGDAATKSARPERDTEPSVDTRLLRDAFVAAGRSS